MEPHSIVTKARELQPLIRQHLVEGERRARSAEEVIDAVGKLGLFRLAAPREVGGLEASPAVFLDAMEAIAAADPGVTWCMVNSAGVCLATASLAEKEREQVFAERNRPFGYSGAMVGKATPIDGGYRVTGQWPVVTGCEDAAWCGLSGIVMEDANTPRMAGGYPDMRLFLIPRTDIEIVPTWKEAASMRGTGSNQVRAHDVFVPEGLAHSSAKPLVVDRPLFQLPLAMLFAPGVAGVAFGVLSTALEVSIQDLSVKVSTFSGQALREQTPTLALISNSTAALRAARAGIIQAADAVWEVAQTGAPVPLRLKADVYASCFYAFDVARDTISRLYSQGTRAAFLQGNPVERALRNIHAIVFGTQAIRPLYDAAGRVLLGGEPLIPVF